MPKPRMAAAVIKENVMVKKPGMKFSQEFIDDVVWAIKRCNELQDETDKQKERIKDLEAENEKLRKLLQDALPHIECKNNSQSGLITEIGELLSKP